MKVIVVFGNDHTNTVGVVQSLGLAGYQSVGLIFGHRTGYVSNSIYTTDIICAKDPQACIEKLLNSKYSNNSNIPIVACCDIVALTLEKNTQRLKGKFVFEYTKHYTLEFLAKKENQVEMAIAAGFNVPKTWRPVSLDKIPEDITFPCLIKPLISCEGAKCDIRVCNNKNELEKNLKTLKVTKEILLQQYIQRDYEISILGCGLSNGECIIPAVENKLTLYPKHVGLECLANVQPLTDNDILNSIKNLINKMGYVGLFSVEMMHSKTDGKFYFTEINLRNDGAEFFITKYGANLPLNHVEDLLRLPITQQREFKPGYYIWDMHHLRSFLSGDISIITWIKEIMKSNGFLMYLKEDKRPFFRQYLYMLGRLLRIIKVTDYK